MRPADQAENQQADTEAVTDLETSEDENDAMDRMGKLVKSFEEKKAATKAAPKASQGWGDTTPIPIVIKKVVHKVVHPVVKRVVRPIKKTVINKIYKPEFPRKLVHKLLLNNYKQNMKGYYTLRHELRQHRAESAKRWAVLRKMLSHKKAIHKALRKCMRAAKQYAIKSCPKAESLASKVGKLGHLAYKLHAAAKAAGQPHMSHAAIHAILNSHMKADFLGHKADYKRVEAARAARIAAWKKNRKAVNDKYNNLYNKYVEMLAKYFRKKYKIMIREYVRKYRSNIRLRRELAALMHKHKSAMLEHARLHRLAFIKQKQLEAMYRKLQGKYDALVDKYKDDMAAAKEAFNEQTKVLDHERAKVKNLLAIKKDLETKLKNTRAELATTKNNLKLSKAESARLQKRLNETLALLSKTKLELEAEIKEHKMTIAGLEMKVADREKQIEGLTAKLAAAQAAAKAAAEKAAAAYAKLMGQFTALKAKAEQAAKHNAAAIKALKADKAKLTATVAQDVKTLIATKKADDARAALAARKYSALMNKYNGHVRDSTAQLKQKQGQIDTATKAIASLKAQLERANEQLSHANEKVSLLKDAHGTAKAALAATQKNAAWLRARSDGFNRDLNNARRRLAGLRSQVHAMTKSRDHWRRVSKHYAALWKSALSKTKNLQRAYSAAVAKFRRVKSASSGRNRALRRVIAAQRRRIRELARRCIPDACGVCGGDERSCARTRTSQQCHAVGDPHYRTFDGLTYDYQVVGEWVLARHSWDFEV